MVSEGFSIDSFILAEKGDIVLPTSNPTLMATVAATLAPVNEGGAYGGVATVIPGLIEAEEFDEGGEGVAYSDWDPDNNGGVRTAHSAALSLQQCGSGQTALNLCGM